MGKGLSGPRPREALQGASLRPFPAVGMTVGFLAYPLEMPMKMEVAVVNCTTGRSAGLAPLRMLPV